MTSRERVTRAIEFDNPDRVPIMHGVLPAAYLAHGQALIDLLREFPDDFGVAKTARVPTREDMEVTYRAGRHTDNWGCVWENEHEGMLGICVGHPLEDWSNWPSYRLPDIPDPQTSVPATGSSPREHYTFGFGFNLFERMQFLRGYETLMYDLASRAREAYILRDALVEWAVEYGRRSAAGGADAAGFADDWGTQVSLIISPDAWREFFRPAYERMFEPALSAGKHIHFHTDGFTWDILGDLVDLGVNVLNVQHTIMDLRALSREFGGRVAFRSDLDRQHILPHGSRDEVCRHVRDVVECLGSFGGGLIGHGEIGPDVPLDNVRAMLEAWHEFGTY